ncbi:ABC transporter ATP-binding protein [Peptoniphilus sp. oral taxon 386]|uniref:ABC transporter ATP-binding protein n=1 Tax=Peptoniphilus sp. oral taxon 386 TaxID=652713 RepID=UPI0001DA998B|nr:ABC transporter ATP-binding protein [Peptoniphilus sp. oral taxon 386]EFI41421.1 ABC transporter, ATP-binding protein [Peptoniphilus sp. oral taxon 386 str. F0131]
MIGGFMINRIKKMFGLTETGARGLVRASISSFFMYLAYMAPIILIMYFIQGLIENNLNGINFYIVGILVLAIAMYAIIYINYNTLYMEVYKESANLRIEIANILKALPLSYFSKHDISDLSQAVMKDVSDIEHAMSHAIPQVIGFIIYLIVISIMMLTGNFKLGLCVIIPVVLSFIMLILSKKFQIYGTTKYYKNLRENSESFQEAIELQQEIKSYGQSEKVAEDLNRKVEKTEKIHIASEFYQAIPVSLSSSVLRFTLGLTILFGSILYIRGEVSLLYLIGYLAAASKIIDGVSGLYMNIAEILYIDARIKRIQELRGVQLQGGEKFDIKQYDIEFKDVEFSYNDERKVIDKVSFIAKQNEVTALVGPSGCGKTSILRLMSRLYDYDKGQIIIDGKEIKNIDTDSLFEKISIVFQDVTLFNTSVMENIRIGNKNASDEDVIKAAKLANCNEFIEKLPDGYNTFIGENGSKLSGGERQRISIARAILKDAPIIILDEISASLDVENEMKIQEGLNTLIKNKTVVIISHRLKSIEKADKIVVLENGKVESIGKHDELMKTSKLYNRMIQRSNITEEYLY